MKTFKLDAISVGSPQDVEYNGKIIRTSIYKKEVSGPVNVTTTNIEGDGQADLRFHGGPTRAICAYPSEYYDFWRKELGDQITWGYLGENLNICGGIFEKEVHVGDQFSIGAVVLEALQPRFPCHKLGMRLGDQKWVKEIFQSGQTGFYLRVLQEGQISTKDEIRQIKSCPENIVIQDITDLYTTDSKNIARMEQALGTPQLPQAWRDHFLEQLDKLKA